MHHATLILPGGIDAYYMHEQLQSAVIEILHEAARLEYIMLLKFPIILSRNSFIFYPLILKLFLIKISLLP